MDLKIKNFPFDWELYKSDDYWAMWDESIICLYHITNLDCSHIFKKDLETGYVLYGTFKGDYSDYFHTFNLKGEPQYKGEMGGGRYDKNIYLTPKIPKSVHVNVDLEDW